MEWLQIIKMTLLGIATANGLFFGVKAIRRRNQPLDAILATLIWIALMIFIRLMFWAISK